jgi:hypothetical protein
MRVALFLAALLAAGVPAFAQQAEKAVTGEEARDANLSAYVELLRSDVRTQKVAIITEMMQFSEEQDAKFWPIYREYEVELARINDDRIALIKEYGAAYDKMTDAIAETLATRVLNLEARRHALKEKYFAQLKSVLPTVSVFRFFQVENQISLLLDLQIAASLPIIR